MYVPALAARPVKGAALLTARRKQASLWERCAATVLCCPWPRRQWWNWEEQLELSRPSPGSGSEMSLKGKCGGELLA